MELEILDSNLERICLVDNYQSLIWTERYNEYGDFELVVPSTLSCVRQIKMGYYAYLKESNNLMIFETISNKVDPVDGDLTTYSGRSLESILERRILESEVKISADNKVEDVIYNLINDNFINPSNNLRKVSKIKFVRNTKDLRVKNLTFESLLDDESGDLIYGIGENVYNIIQEICRAFELGFRIVNSGKGSSSVFNVSLYKGADRRSNNEDNNPVVMFAPEFDNLRSFEDVKSDKEVKNAALVYGNNDIYGIFKSYSPSPSNTKTWLVVKDEIEEDTKNNLLTFHLKNIFDDDLIKIIAVIKSGYPFTLYNKTFYEYRIIENIRVENFDIYITLRKSTNSKYILDKSLGSEYYDYADINKDSISINVRTQNTGSLIYEFAKNGTIANGNIFIENKKYDGFKEIDSIEGNYKRNSIVNIKKPTENENHNIEILINNNKYYCDKTSVNFSNNSLSFKLNNFATTDSSHDQLYTDLVASGGNFIIDGFNYTDFKKITSFSYNDGSLSVSLSKETPKDPRYNIVINGKTYTASSWSRSEDTISVNLLYNSGNIEDLLLTIIRDIKTTNIISIDGIDYVGFNDVNNWSLSWSNGSTSNDRSISIQFRKIDKKTVTINNVVYEYDSYSENEDTLSITFTNITHNKISNLLADIISHCGNLNPIVIDNKTFNDYIILDNNYTVDYLNKETSRYVDIDTSKYYTTVSVNIRKDTSKNIKIYVENGIASLLIYENRVNNIDISDSNIAFEVDGLSYGQINDLVSLFRNIKSNDNRKIVIDNETYDNFNSFDYAEASEYSYFDPYEQTKFLLKLSFSKNEQNKEYEQIHTYAYKDNSSKPSSLNRKELFVNESSYALEQEDGTVIEKDAYISNLVAKGRSKLVSREDTRTMDATFEFNSQFKYGRDFYMGDYINVEDKQNNFCIVQVVEYIRSQDSSGINEYPTFNIKEIYNE